MIYAVISLKLMQENMLRFWIMWNECRVYSIEYSIIESIYLEWLFDDKSRGCFSDINQM